MAFDDDDDAAGESEGIFHALGIDPSQELRDVLDDLQNLLKNPEVVGHLTDRGINASLALLALDAVDGYLTGDKKQAAEDFRTVSEEIEGRLKFGNDPPLA